MARYLAAALLSVLLGGAGIARADGAVVAVATNFATAAEHLEREFEAGQDRLTLVAGSTGKLYAQIVHGAPFDVLLSADQERPAALVSRGRISVEQTFTYAVGRLVLWSADPQLLQVDPRGVLGAGRFRRLALANPELAPYGRAALQTLRSLGYDEALQKKLVYGENVGQAHALVATGNAELGFVAHANVIAERRGSRWAVPAALHAPVLQDAVLLNAASAEAVAFFDFLRSAPARRVIARFGYGLPESDD